MFNNSADSESLCQQYGFVQGDFAQAQMIHSLADVNAASVYPQPYFMGYGQPAVIVPATPMPSMGSVPPGFENMAPTCQAHLRCTCHEGLFPVRPFDLDFEGLYLEENFREAAELARQMVIQSMEEERKQFQMQDEMQYLVQPQMLHNFTTRCRRGKQPNYRLVEKYNEKPYCFKKLQLENIRGSMLQFAQSPHGALFIQTKLETCNEEQKGIVFKELYRHFPALLDDVYGNYVVQKFLELGNERYNKRIVMAILEDVKFNSTQNRASRVIQKAIDIINPQLLQEICSALRKHSMELIKSQHGNHVIQHAMRVAGPDFLQGILEDIAVDSETVRDVASDQFGNRVIQCCLELGTKDQLEEIIPKILQHFDFLMDNSFGTHTLRCCLEYGTDGHREQIMTGIAPKWSTYAMEKHASFVVDKCLMLTTNFQKGILIRALCKEEKRSLPQLIQMIGTAEAEHAVQRVFHFATVPQRREMIATISSHSAELLNKKEAKISMGMIGKYIPSYVVTRA